MRSDDEEPHYADDRLEYRVAETVGLTLTSLLRKAGLSVPTWTD
jgi:hypothetical protein